MPPSELDPVHRVRMLAVLSRQELAALVLWLGRDLSDTAFTTLCKDAAAAAAELPALRRRRAADEPDLEPPAHL